VVSCGGLPVVSNGGLPVVSPRGLPMVSTGGLPRDATGSGNGGDAQEGAAAPPGGRYCPGILYCCQYDA